jgi:hypothetical protein
MAFIVPASFRASLIYVNEPQHREYKRTDALHRSQHAPPDRLRPETGRGECHSAVLAPLRWCTLARNIGRRCHRNALAVSKLISGERRIRFVECQSIKPLGASGKPRSWEHCSASAHISQPLQVDPTLMSSPPRFWLVHLGARWSVPSSPGVQIYGRERPGANGLAEMASPSRRFRARSSWRLLPSKA